jgi:dihydrofolate reductase
MSDRGRRIRPTVMTMRKIIVGAQVSIDGVMQSPGGPSEDPTNGFRFGGWSMPYFDEVAGEEMDKLFAEPFDLLLGRKTYEIFAAYWAYYDETDPEAGAIAKRFNEATKYAVSRSGDVDLGWKGSVLLSDIDAVKRLKQEGGRNLLTQGSTELVHALFGADLVDELSIHTMPVILGGGKKLFADGSAPHELALTSSRVAPSGAVITRYARGGAVKTGDVPLDKPSPREAARQARMKKEG